MGKEDALVVKAGQVYLVAPGSTHDWPAITVEKGGTLQVGRGSGWTFLGCSGVVTIEGQLRATSDNWDAAATPQDNAAGQFRAYAPDGTALSYSIVQSRGGQGGGSGAQRAGNGGGGGLGVGASRCTDATDTAGGHGAPCASTLAGAPGGLYGQRGGDGIAATGSGGGGRGYHGMGLYLVVGSGLGSGVITVEGQPGGDGGVDRGGGGGGGAAGGSGGRIVIRHGGEGPSWELRLAGGTGGSALGTGASAGEAGHPGSSDVQRR